jgi:DNA-binding SARP family transcriptional activator
MPHVTEQAAERVTGLRGAGAVLAQLHRQNLFTTRRSSTPPTYTYHPLFRDFLMRQSRDRLPADQLAGVHRRAALALASAGAPHEAIEILRQQGDWQTAVPIVMEHAPRLFATAQISTLQGWLAWLPEVAYQEAWLLLWKASAATVTSPTDGVALWRRAFAAFRARGDPAGTLLAWAGAVHAIILEERDLRQLDPFLAELEALLDAGTTAPTPEIDAKLAAAALLAYTQRELMAVVPAWEARVRRAFAAARDVEQQIALGSTLLFYLTFVGDFDAADVLLASMRGLVANVVDPLIRLQMLVAEAFLLAHNRRSPNACADVVDEGLRLSAASGLPLHREYLICYGLTSTVQYGDRAGTERYIALAQQGVISERARGFFSWIRGIAALEFENTDVALPWLERAFDAARAIGYREGIVLSCGGLACALIERGDLRLAAQRLNEAEALTTASPRARTTLLVARGAFLQAAGQPEAALAKFTASLALCRQYGLSAGGWLPRTAIARLSSLALEAGVETEFVLETIERRKLQPPSDGPRPRRWPWPVKVVAMGDFQLWFGRGQCFFQGKPPKMPLRLLKTLIAAGATSSVNADELAEALWPDADGDLGRRTLDTTASRLRKVIRHEGAIITSDGSLRLSSDVVFVDAFAIQPLASVIADRLQRGDCPGSTGIDDPLEDLFALYQGPFLPGADELPGVLRTRDRLCKLFVQTIVRCGQRLEEGNHPEAALALYDRGLVVEETSEPLYQRALACHATLGQKAEATRLWNSCQKALDRRLGVEPSRNTRRAFEQAM